MPVNDAPRGRKVPGQFTDTLTTRRLDRRTAMNDSVFTRIIRREIPAAIVFEDDQVIAFMDAGQVNPGHVLVATRRQLETVMELEEAEAAHLFAVAHRVARAVQAAFAPEGMTLLQTRACSNSFLKCERGAKGANLGARRSPGRAPGRGVQQRVAPFAPRSLRVAAKKTMRGVARTCRGVPRRHPRAYRMAFLIRNAS